MIDIANREELLRFLAERRIFGSSGLENLYIRYFDGGVSAAVALAKLDGKAVIVKQALSKLRVKADWLCDQSRMAVEQAALEVYARLIPGSVPAPICYDADHYIMVREAAPENCSSWKQQLLDGLLDFEVARKSVDALCDIHNHSAGDIKIAEEFKDSRFFYDLRVSAYIEQVAGKHPQVATLAKEVATQLMTERLCLTHGDYSPKNILVHGREIFVLDYEVSYYGHPGFDIAFFTNHFLLKAFKNREWSEAYLSMLLYMVRRYFGRVTVMDKDLLEAQTICMLGLLLLARIDGKSPAEYIVRQEDQAAARRLALEICQARPTRYEAVAELFRSHTLR